MISKNIKTLIISILSLLIILILLQPLQVHAGGNINGTGTDGSAATETGIVGGWADWKSGLRIYVVNESNTSKSPVLDVWFSNYYDEVDSEYEVVTRAGTRLASRFRTVLASDLLDGKIPTPWVDEFSNEKTLEGWLLTVPDGEDACNAELAIRELFGDHVLDEFYKNVEYEPYYLCIEGLSCFGIYSPENETKINGVWQNFQGYYFAGTFYNFCQLCRDRVWTTGGVPLKSRTNEVFARALMLDEKGWTTKFSSNFRMPSKLDGIIEMYEGLNQAYDIIMYRISDMVMNGIIDTYDEALGETPGRAPEPKSKGQEGVFSIVKIYAVDHKDGSDLEYEGCYTRKEVCKNINISDEPNYSVREWTTSQRIVKVDLPSGTTWPEVKDPFVQKGSSQGTVTLDPEKPNSERTLFVLLVREEEIDDTKDLILNESEITRYYEFNKVKEFKSLDRRIKWTVDSISLGPCMVRGIHGDHGSYEDEEGNSHTIPCNCFCLRTSVVVTDPSLNLKIKNNSENSYSHILATKGTKFKPEIDPKENPLTLSSTSGATIAKQVNYKFVIWRGQDELTLAENSYKISTDKISYLNSTIQTLINRQNAKPTGTRWVERETDVPFNLQFIEDPSGDYTRTARLTCGHDGDHEYRVNPQGTLNANSSVKVFTYSGSPSYTVANSSATPQSSMQSVTQGNGVPVKSDTVFSFYPYIRMTYEEMGSTAKKDANVMSQHKRSFSFSNYAEIGYKSSPNNLTVTSQQWSTHQLAISTWGKNRVLPGGALYSVSTASGGTTLTLRTFQVVADGDAQELQKLQEGGSTGLEDATQAKAREEHQKYVQSCVTVWNNGYGLELGVNKNDSVSDVFTGNYLIANRGGEGFNGSLSEESKYYFNNTAESLGNIQNGLFQASAGGTSERFFKISSDTSGNIYLDNDCVLTKTQSVTQLKKGSMAKYIDDRTKVISNFVSAIERNTGEDYTASWAEGEDDGRWYNEAFAVYVLMQETKVTVGLNSPARRETTMDPNLIPRNSGKSDYFSSGYSFQFRNTSGSITQGDIKGNSGEFRDTGVSLASISQVFRSKVFVLPNVNVQDLKD